MVTRIITPCEVDGLQYIDPIYVKTEMKSRSRSRKTRFQGVSAARNQAPIIHRYAREERIRSSVSDG